MKATGAKLYSIPMSHPGHAVRLMLQRKRIEHDVKYLMTGSQPADAVRSRLKCQVARSAALAA